MNCPNCGQLVTDNNATKCPNCGNSLVGFYNPNSGVNNELNVEKSKKAIVGFSVIFMIFMFGPLVLTGLFAIAISLIANEMANLNDIFTVFNYIILILGGGLGLLGLAKLIRAEKKTGGAKALTIIGGILILIYVFLAYFSPLRLFNNYYDPTITIDGKEFKTINYYSKEKQKVFMSFYLHDTGDEIAGNVKYVSINYLGEIPEDRKTAFTEGLLSDGYEQRTELFGETVPDDSVLYVKELGNKNKIQFVVISVAAIAYGVTQ